MPIPVFCYQWFLASFLALWVCTEHLGYAQQASQESGWGSIWQQRMTVGQATLDDALNLAEKGHINDSLQLIDQVIASNPKNWRAYFLKSAVLTLGKRSSEALYQINTSIALARHSNISQGLLATSYTTKSQNCLDIGEASEARKALETAAHVQPRDPVILNELAWMLATSSDAKIRNGRKAVSLATKACQLEGWTDSYTIDTLAAAYAEAGQFNEAVRYEQLAMSKLHPNKKYQLPGMQERLRAFSTQRPVRIP
jgi:Flp pilus assembly protein TadD